MNKFKEDPDLFVVTVKPRYCLITPLKVGLSMTGPEDDAEISSRLRRIGVSASGLWYRNWVIAHIFHAFEPDAVGSRLR